MMLICCFSCALISRWNVEPEVLVETDRAEGTLFGHQTTILCLQGIGSAEITSSDRVTLLQEAVLV